VTKRERASLRRRLLALPPWHRRPYDPAQAPYHWCRHCQRTSLDVSGFWKYGVHHYICDTCKARLEAPDPAPSPTGRTRTREGGGPPS
jgi:hypothetical protein